MIRFALTGTALLVLAALLAACGGDKKSSDVAQTATATPTVTLSQLLVGVEDLPDCKLDREGEAVVRQWSRSFDCASEDRLTLDVWFREDENQAQAGHNIGWSTVDNAKEMIARSISVRPVRQDSLTVTNAPAEFQKIGADREAAYCATYTDLSGSTTITEYYGSFQYKSVHVQYTSWAVSDRGCTGASRAQANAQRLATKQLEKLRAASPR